MDPLVCVLTTGDAGIIAVAKSILEGEQIDYIVQNESLQQLFGLNVARPAEFLVRGDEADRAREVLADLRATADGETLTPEA